MQERVKGVGWAYHRSVLLVVIAGTLRISLDITFLPMVKDFHDHN